MKLAPGDTFGRYTIESTVGMGGMGQVFRATDNLLERIVALKIIRPDRTEREEAIGRFFREAKLAAKLTHPNTIQIYDLGEVGDVPFIAMEFLEGRPFTAFCGEDRAAAPRKLRWLLDAARGLAAAHRLQMIHRDVKPGNVMVSENDVVKVVDFGLAKRTATTPGLRATFNTGLGYVVGTPSYMAPEQLLEGKVDARCDQFSWGITAYVLLTGKNPRLNDPIVMQTIAPIGRDLGVPAPVAAVLAKAVAREPDARHASMDALIAELERHLQSTGDKAAMATTAPLMKPLPPRPPPPPPQDPVIEDLERTEERPPLMIAQHPSSSSEHRMRAAAPATRRLGTRDWLTAPPPAADDSAFRFERTTEPMPFGPLFAAAFSADGKRLLVFGNGGIGVHENGRWSAHASVPTWLSPKDVRCATAARDGSVFVAGKDGLVGRLLADGTARVLSPPDRADVWLRGIEITRQGWLTVVGGKGQRGVIGWVGARGLELEEIATPLHGVSTLSSEKQIACGASGTLVTFDADSMLMRQVTQEELLAIAALGEGAVVVGDNAVALWVDEKLEPRIEDTETRGPLSVVCVSDDGTAWAGSTRGRILRRDPLGRWQRLSPKWDGEPTILALWAKGQHVRAIAGDGSIISGRPSHDDSSS